MNDSRVRCYNDYDSVIYVVHAPRPSLIAEESVLTHDSSHWRMEVVLAQVDSDVYSATD